MYGHAYKLFLKQWTTTNHWLGEPQKNKKESEKEAEKIKKKVSN